MYFLQTCDAWHCELEMRARPILGGGGGGPQTESLSVEERVQTSSQRRKKNCFALVQNGVAHQ